MFKSYIIADIDFGNKEKAVALLYKECYPQIRKYILNNKGSLDDAKDIFQETIISFLSKLDYYKDEKLNIKALLMTIAKNKWTDLVRKNKKNDNIDDIYSIEIQSADKTDNSIHQHEKDSRINEIFKSVGERCKELLVNVLFYEMSMKEVAVKMEFSNENSAKTQHYKCRQKLIELYQHDEKLKQYLQFGDD